MLLFWHSSLGTFSWVGTLCFGGVRRIWSSGSRSSHCVEDALWCDDPHNKQGCSAHPCAGLIPSLLINIKNIWSFVWQRPWHGGECGLQVGAINPGYPKCTQEMLGLPWFCSSLSHYRGFRMTPKAVRLLFNHNWCSQISCLFHGKCPYLMSAFHKG